MRNSALHLRHYHKSISSKQQFLNFSSLPSPVLESQNPCLRIQTPQTHRLALVHLLQLGVSDKPILFFQRIHAQILTSGFQEDVFLANLLLDSYKKSGSIVYARKLFDRMPERNSVTWSSMVSMYTKHGKSEEALKVFLEFHRSSDGRPNEYTLPSVIWACAQFGGVDQGAQVHCFVVKTGFDLEVFVGTSLIDFYVKMGDIEEARLIFDGLKVKSAVTWTIVIAGYAKSGRSEAALKLFYHMRDTDVLPDKYVLSYKTLFRFVIPGNEIPEWFAHQTAAPFLKYPFVSRLVEYEGFGICIVFCFGTT